MEHLHFDGALLTVLYIIAFTNHRNLTVGLIISQIFFQMRKLKPKEVK